MNRKQTHGVVGFRGKPKDTQKQAESIGAEYKLNKHGDIIMNDDNDANRRMVEHCYRTRKTMVNPIVDWEESDVWEFLNGNGIEHCSLYDEGFKRLGCIGCPLSGSKNMIREFERWPKYKELYIRAFQRMIDNHPGEIKILDPNADTKFKLFEEDAENPGGGSGSVTGSTRSIDESPDDNGSKNRGGVLPQYGRGNAMVYQRLVSCLDSSSTTATAKNYMGGVRTRRGNASEMAQSGTVLNSYSTTGLKWVQCNPAEMIFEAFVHQYAYKDIYNDIAKGDTQ